METAMALEVSFWGVAHAALLVSTQEITSPLFNEPEEKELELAPMLFPFSFH